MRDRQTVRFAVRLEAVAMAEDQRNARIFGVLFLITFITSIPALILFRTVLDDPVGYIASAGQDNRILFGALLELLLWVVRWGNGLILGYLMYASGLVPRKMAMLGLIGGPLIIVSGTLVMFGVADAGGPCRGSRRSRKPFGSCCSASTTR